MMRKSYLRISIVLIPLLMFSGCTSIHIPSYIQDKFPYKQNFYDTFDNTYNQTLKTLKNLGWRIAGTAEPTTFERNKSIDDTRGQHILILTDIRQTPMFIGTRYARINAYIRSVNVNTTEVELRYMTVSSIPFKTFYLYKNDAAVQRIFHNIEEELQ